MTAPATTPGWPARMRVELAAAYVGLSASAWRRLVAAGLAPAPKPVPGCPRVRAWLKADLDAHLAANNPGRLASPDDLYLTG